MPTDGGVVDGSSYVDESMITGKPVAVAKEAGSEVVDGTINKTGAFSFRATRVGAETVLAQIIRMVEETQGSKLPIQALVDKVTEGFVPAVMAVAALTFALINAVAMLIIACPCTMDLSVCAQTFIKPARGLCANGQVLRRDAQRRLCPRCGFRHHRPGGP